MSKEILDFFISNDFNISVVLLQRKYKFTYKQALKIYVSYMDWISTQDRLPALPKNHFYQKQYLIHCEYGVELACYSIKGIWVDGEGNKIDNVDSWLDKPTE